MNKTMQPTLQPMIVRRGKGLVRNALTLKDAYKDYSKLSKGKGAFEQPLSMYRKVCTMFNQMAMNTIILDESGVLTLPHRGGKLFIKKRKVPASQRNKMKIDWKSTNEYGRTIYFLNTHTNGYNYRFCWDKKDCVIKNKSRYTFMATRTYKRRLAALLKDPNKPVDYFG